MRAASPRFVVVVRPARRCRRAQSSPALRCKRAPCQATFRVRDLIIGIQALEELHDDEPDAVDGLLPAVARVVELAREPVSRERNVHVARRALRIQAHDRALRAVHDADRALRADHYARSSSGLLASATCASLKTARGFALRHRFSARRELAEGDWDNHIACVEAERCEGVLRRD